MESTNNAINVTSVGLIGYDGAGTFHSSSISQSNVVIGGGTSSTYSGVASPSSNGVPLISQAGTGAAPVFGTCTVQGGGTGVTSLSANQVMLAGGTSTSAMQQVSGGTSGQILTATGTTSAPTFQTLPVISSWRLQSASVTASDSVGYFVNNNTVTITLPTGGTTGNTIAIYNDVGSSIVVNAGASQTIRIGSSTSSSGGTATSATQGDCLTLVYLSGSTTWYCTASQGTWVLA